MAAGSFDRRVQFRRASLSDDGLSSELAWNTSTPSADDHGVPVSASKMDVSDGERWRAGEVGATITARFVIWSSAFSRGITHKDRLVCEGVQYEIVGIKEIGRRDRLEITAAARSDV